MTAGTVEGINVRDVARIALYFVCETETFSVFKRWAETQAITPTADEWAAGLTLDGLRAVARELHRLDCHEDGEQPMSPHDLRGHDEPQ